MEALVEKELQGTALRKALIAGKKSGIAGPLEMDKLKLKLKLKGRKALQAKKNTVLSIVTTAPTESDLLEIWLYTAEEWNFAQADKYMAQIENSLNNLLKHPEPGQDRSDLRKSYRSLLVNHPMVSIAQVRTRFK